MTLLCLVHKFNFKIINLLSSKTLPNNMAAKLHNSKLFQSVLHPTKYLTFISRCTASEPPQTVILEKSLEDPVVVLAENDDVDIIGPPDPVSNLRPVIRKRLLTESILQTKLRTMQDETHAWNQAFWIKHNTNFVKERSAFIDSQQKVGEEKKQLTADEMSEFYRSFLDKNWTNHVNYNLEWYKKNFTLLFLALRVEIEKNVLKTIC